MEESETNIRLVDIKEEDFRIGGRTASDDDGMY